MRVYYQKKESINCIPIPIIDKVEVITSPSARYDSEGTGGILNIILKKQELLGVNGNFVANIGVPNTYGGSASINFRNDKFNIFTVNSLRQSRSKGYFYNDNEYFNGDDPSTFLEEERKPLRDNGSIFTNLGIEFYLKENTSLILSGFYRDRKGDNVPEVALCKELGIEMLWNVGGDKIQSSSWLVNKSKENQ